MSQGVPRARRVALGPEEMEEAISADSAAAVGGQNGENGGEPTGQFCAAAHASDLQAESAKYKYANHLRHLIPE